MTPKPLAPALVLIALLASAAPLRAEPLRAEPPEECLRFVIQSAPQSSAELRLVRLCARLMELSARRDLTREEAVAAQRLGDYLAVLARLELRAVREGEALRLRVARRASATARYLIADRLGLIALADRLAPSA